MCSSIAPNSCKCKVGNECNGLRCVPPLLECSVSNRFCMLGSEKKCKCKTGTVCDGMNCVSGHGSDGTCVDLDPQRCPTWAANDECSKNRPYMSKWCQKSCKLCKID
jgi:hypothetical protein